VPLESVKEAMMEELLFAPQRCMAAVKRMAPRSLTVPA